MERLMRGTIWIGALALTAAVGAAQESRRSFATAVFLDDWERWSGEAHRTFADRKALGPTKLQSAKDAAARIAKEIAALREKTPTEAACETRPAERVKRILGDREESLAKFVENGEAKQRKRKRAALSELKDLRDAFAPRVDEVADRKRRLDALAKQLEELRKTWVAGLQESPLSAAERGRLFDLPESLALCAERLKKAAEEDAALKVRAERLLARYDDAIEVYRSL
jgi:hypothetical protein